MANGLLEKAAEKAKKEAEKKAAAAKKAAEVAKRKAAALAKVKKEKEEKRELEDERKHALADIRGYHEVHGEQARDWFGMAISQRREGKKPKDFKHDDAATKAAVKDIMGFVGSEERSIALFEGLTGDNWKKSIKGAKPKEAAKAEGAVGKIVADLKKLKGQDEKWDKAIKDYEAGNITEAELEKVIPMADLPPSPKPPTVDAMGESKVDASTFDATADADGSLYPDELPPTEPPADADKRILSAASAARRAANKLNKKKARVTAKEVFNLSSAFSKQRQKYQDEVYKEHPVPGMPTQLAAFASAGLFGTTKWAAALGARERKMAIFDATMKTKLDKVMRSPTATAAYTSSPEKTMAAEATANFFRIFPDLGDDIEWDDLSQVVFQGIPKSKIPNAIVGMANTITNARVARGEGTPVNLEGVAVAVQKLSMIAPFLASKVAARADYRVKHTDAQTAGITKFVQALAKDGLPLVMEGPEQNDKTKNWDSFQKKLAQMSYDVARSDETRRILGKTFELAEKKELLDWQHAVLTADKNARGEGAEFNPENYPEFEHYPDKMAQLRRTFISSLYKWNSGKQEDRDAMAVTSARNLGATQGALAFRKNEELKEEGKKEGDVDWWDNPYKVEGAEFEKLSEQLKTEAREAHTAWKGAYNKEETDLLTLEEGRVAAKAELGLSQTYQRGRTAFNLAVAEVGKIAAFQKDKKKRETEVDKIIARFEEEGDEATLRSAYDSALLVAEGKDETATLEWYTDQQIKDTEFWGNEKYLAELHGKPFTPPTWEGRPELEEYYAGKIESSYEGHKLAALDAKRIDDLKTARAAIKAFAGAGYEMKDEVVTSILAASKGNPEAVATLTQDFKNARKVFEGETLIKQQAEQLKTAALLGAAGHFDDEVKPPKAIIKTWQDTIDAIFESYKTTEGMGAKERKEIFDEGTERAWVVFEDDVTDIASTAYAGLGAKDIAGKVAEIKKMVINPAAGDAKLKELKELVGLQTMMEYALVSKLVEPSRKKDLTKFKKAGENFYNLEAMKAMMKHVGFDVATIPESEKKWERTLELRKQWNATSKEYGDNSNEAKLAKEKLDLHTAITYAGWNLKQVIKDGKITYEVEQPADAEKSLYRIQVVTYPLGSRVQYILAPHVMESDDETLKARAIKAGEAAVQNVMEQTKTDKNWVDALGKKAEDPTGTDARRTLIDLTDEERPLVIDFLKKVQLNPDLSTVTKEELLKWGRFLPER